MSTRNRNKWLVVVFGSVATLVIGGCVCTRQHCAPCLPDLQMVSVTASLDNVNFSPQDNPSVGLSNRIYITDVTSNRIHTACQSKVRLYLQRINEPMKTWYWKDSEHDTSSLNEGGSESFVSGLQVPSNIPTGEYYVFAVCGFGIKEMNPGKANNTNSCRINVIEHRHEGGADSDLCPHVGWTSPTNGAPGASLSVSSVTTNCSANSSSSSTTKIYLKIQPTGRVNNQCVNSQTLPSGCTYWFPHSVGALGANKSQTNTSTRTIPTGLSTGIYDVIAVCDTTGSGLQCTVLCSPNARNNDTNLICRIQVQ